MRECEQLSTCKSPPTGPQNHTPTKGIPGALGTISAIKPSYLIVQMAKLRPPEAGNLPKATLPICSRKDRVPNQVAAMEKGRSCQQGALQPAHLRYRILENVQSVDEGRSRVSLGPIRSNRIIHLVPWHPRPVSAGSPCCFR